MLQRQEAAQFPACSAFPAAACRGETARLCTHGRAGVAAADTVPALRTRVTAGLRGAEGGRSLDKLGRRK